MNGTYVFTVKPCKTRIFYIKIIRKYGCLWVRNLFYFSKKVRLISQNDVLFLFYFLINPTMTTARVCQEFCPVEYMRGMGCAWHGAVHSRGCAWLGGNAWHRGMHGGGCVWGVHGRRDGHCSGRYASYWNAFSFLRFVTNCSYRIQVWSVMTSAISVHTDRNGGKILIEI